jgi:protein-ribulosamine 3-kinase
MTLPPSIQAAVTRTLSPVEGVERVGGGCIDPACRIQLAHGENAFLKWSRERGPRGFGVEARGLEALAGRGGIPVPRVLGWDDGSADTRGWLLLEWIDPGDAHASTGGTLGEGLATLHRPLPSGTEPGWEEDGWIATLPQANPQGIDWPRFWAEARLLPQWEAARNAGYFSPDDQDRMEALLAHLPLALAAWEADGLALLHGDLWSGNVLVGIGGEPHLVDPAVYRGHREVDLAMLELFGAPWSGWRERYEAAAPLQPDYDRVRRGIYQLYPLLVHVNLFGGGYVARTRATLEQALAQL